MRTWRVEVVRTTIELWEVVADTAAQAKEATLAIDGELLAAEVTRSTVRSCRKVTHAQEEN
jgi:hypothetical protein